MPAQPIIEVHNLYKTFKKVVAVDHISFAIREGQCFGLLGPNGAGKSTTIEIIEGITEPTAGRILYKGQTRGSQFKQEVGIQFQSTALMEFLTVRDQLTMFSQLYKNRLNIEELITTCELGSFLDQNALKLSGGQRKRLLLAIALINDPKILFLDEPTTGLDPQSRSNFWALVKRIKKQGKTVVLTTHYMEEAEILCDYLTVMDHGKIIAEGSPRQLLDSHFNYVMVTLRLSDWKPGTLLSDDWETQEEEEIIIRSRSVAKTIAELLANNIDLASLQVRRPTLEDLFLQLTGHSLIDAEQEA